MAPYGTSGRSHFFGIGKQESGSYNWVLSTLMYFHQSFNSQLQIPNSLLMRIAAIVPMRHSSERVPGKNYRDFAGKPLYHHIIESLLACEKISQVVIDTDSPVILAEAPKYFPTVTLLERPEHLRAGEIPMNDVLLNTINQLDADFFLQTHSTNPLLTPESIRKGVEIFLKNYPIYDSLFTVTRWQTRLWDQLARAVNHNPNILLRTQDLPPIYEENSCMYIFSKSILERKHNRIGDRPYLLEISKEEAQDIDIEIEFRIAEFLYQARMPSQSTTH